MQNQQAVKQPRKKKETFLLKDIVPEAIEQKYGITASKTDVTPIAEIPCTFNNPSTRSEHYFTMVDDTKRMCITMLDSITKGSIQAKTCFWCRHDFTNIPIGCPIRYVPTAIVKTCQSEITKEIYHLKQSIPNNAIEKLDISDAMRIVNGDYYETDGSFCSFNCCMAYISDNSTNPLYSQSKMLLMKLYITIFNPSELTKINLAPSWRLLQAYGGFMSIDEFRSASNDFIYIDHDYQVINIPKLLSAGYIFEEVYIF